MLHDLNAVVVPELTQVDVSVVVLDRLLQQVELNLETVNTNQRQVMIMVQTTAVMQTSQHVPAVMEQQLMVHVLVQEPTTPQQEYMMV